MNRIFTMARNLKTGRFPHKNVIYCRFSSNNQKDDLKSQVTAMERFCLAPGVTITQTIEEIGGGLNFKRPKCLQIIQWAIAGELETLYVAHKDRLCRFGFDLVEQIVSWGGGEIVVANVETLSGYS